MKVSRYGILVGDLLDEKVLREKIRFACAEKNAILTSVYGKEAFDPDSLTESYLKFGEILKERITNVTVLVNDAISAGKSVMFEGAQGTLLDIDHGTYPYVTSSSCTAGGICTGLGVAPKHVHGVLGVAKAYTTRVGGGPFPTELTNPVGEHLRKRGNEFGTTTGRPRRTGWLDLVILRTAGMLNGTDAIALTKVDVFDDFDEIKVCTDYRVGGNVQKTYPSFAVAHNDYTPTYRTFKGWKRSTVGTETFDELPSEAKDYIRFIEDELETPVTIVSTGPRREETILRGDGLEIRQSN